MKRYLIGAGAATAALAAPVAATAQPPSPAHAHAYERAYHEVAQRLGPRVPGRNILEDGSARRGQVTDAETVASLTVLRRMLAPAAMPTPASTATAPPTAAAATTPTAATSAPTAAPAGSPGVPACAAESGGNYSTGAGNTNPTTGATGRYQIEPSTAAAYGCSLSTPAGQDACAQAIYAHQGAGAWVGCGG